MSKISVIIPAYNAEKYIKEALDSVLDQTYPTHEIIVVDDGSTDSTEKIVKEYIGSPGHQVTRSPVDIKYIYQMNKGPGAARNAGIKEAKGEYVAFLDSDDMWMPEKIEKQVKKIEEDAEYGLIHVNRMRLEPDGTEKVIKREIPEGFIFNELLMENFIFCSSILVKKLCFDVIGLFEEGNNDISEDYDMWLRIAKKYKAGFVNEPLIKYRINLIGYCRSKIGIAYDREKAAFLKALEFYVGDKEKLKRERFYNLARKKTNSLFYLKEYRLAFLALCEALSIRYLGKA